MKRTLKWQDFQLVEVVWIDATIKPSHEGDLDDSSTLAKFGGLDICRDIGYLVDRNRKVIKLAVSIGEDNTYRHANTIPTGWVKRIIPLTRSEAINEDPPQPPPA